MRDIRGELWNLQRIYPDGSKRFLKDGRIIGLCARIGMRTSFARGVFAEGFATGDAISKALDGRCPVIVAFNTANLETVVAEWTRAFPRADWVIAADDDHLTGLKMIERGQPYQNPGIEKAEGVAAAHGCKVAYPVRREGENTDFSDLLLAGREAAIVAAIGGAKRKVEGPGAALSLAERIGRAA
jgi:putative DNA primase/helicase